MAVVYFTSNASTGSGSLAQAIKNASPGDVIRPDETVFERGSTIEIALASKLTIDKDLTLDASPFRVRLDGGSKVQCVYITGANASFTAFDFVRGVATASGACAFVGSNANATFDRCLFAGGSTIYGGGATVVSSSTATFNDCLVVGCRSSEVNGAGLHIDGSATLNGVTAVGCASSNPNDVYVAWGATATIRNSIIGKLLKSSASTTTVEGSVVDVASSEVGFVASPPDDLTTENWDANAWQNWDLRLLDDASPNPSPYRDSGSVDDMSRYDLDGNFRGRETNGATTCSPGAYETIQADLFWIGRDATGAEVETPSFLTSDGWATSRFATVSGDAAPQVGQTVFVDGAVTFGDVLPTSTSSPASVVVGGLATINFDTTKSSYLVALQVGVGAVFNARAVNASALPLFRFGAWSRITRLTSSVACEFDANAYVASGWFYNAFVSPVPTYGSLTVAPTTLDRVRLDGVYVCDSFVATSEGTSPTRTIKIGDSATIRAKSATIGASATAPFETLFDKRVTIALHDSASLTVGAAAPESWADAFEVDVSEATSATLTLNGQTVYGDAPTAAVELSGSAKVDARGLDVASLALTADSSLTIVGATVNVAALTLADGAVVGFSGDDATLAATNSATVGAATFSGVGYFATPTGTSLSAATIPETVRACDYGADVSSFNALSETSTSALLSWVKQNPTPSVLIEEANESGWNVVNNRATGDSLSVDISAPKTFRLFDGESFFTASARPYGTAYELAEEQTIGYLKTLISTGYLN